MAGRSSRSIVRRPVQFVFKWYDIDAVYQALNYGSESGPFGEIPKAPEDVTSPEFAEWLTRLCRAAMRKGAELAVAEMKENNDGAACPNCGEPSQIFTADMDWCPKCKRQWYV